MRNDENRHHLVVNGRLAGSWDSTVQKDSMLVTIAPYHRLTPGDARQVKAASQRLGTFVDLPIAVSMA